MKIMKLKLADDKVYSFSTFTIRQQLALKDIVKEAMAIDTEVRNVEFKTDEKGELVREGEDNLPVLKTMTDQDRERMFVLQFKLVDILTKVFRMSVARKHPEFKQQEDEAKNIEINEKISDLVDLEDLRDVFAFAARGEVPIRDTEEYDLTKLMEEAEEKVEEKVGVDE